MGQEITPKLKQSPILKINTQSQSYYPNSDITGLINLNLSAPLDLCDIEIEIYSIEGWVYKKVQNIIPEKNENIKDYNINKNTIGKLKLNLPQLFKINSPVIRLNSGNYNFQFSFPLKEFNPSFEYRGDHSRIFLRYILLSKVIVPEKNNNKNNINDKKKNNEEIESETIFQILVKQKENDAIKEYQAEQKVYKWGMINKGNCKMILSIPKSNYKFNDNIPLNILIDNTEGKLNVSKIKVSTKRKITYILNNLKIEEEIPVASSTYGIHLLSKKKQVFRYFYNIKDIYLKYLTYSGVSEPYTNNNIDWYTFIPTVTCNSFSCEYYIKITLYFTSFVHHNSRPRLTFPIIITHNASDNYEFSNINLNQNNNKNNNNNLNLFNSQIININQNNQNPLAQSSILNHQELIEKSLANENKIEKNENEPPQDEDDIENVITDDGSGQLFIYYDRLKKKKMALESKKRGEEMKKLEEEKRKKEEEEIKKQFYEPFPYIVVDKELKDKIMNDLNLNDDDDFNLFEENENDTNNMFIPPYNQNNSNFFVFND